MKLTTLGIAATTDRLGNLIATLDGDGMDAMIAAGTANAGMVAKLNACRTALDAGVAVGLSRVVATELAVQTMAGSAAMLLERTGVTAAELIGETDPWRDRPIASSSSMKMIAGAASFAFAKTSSRVRRRDWRRPSCSVLSRWARSFASDRALRSFSTTRASSVAPLPRRRVPGRWTCVSR